MPTAKKTTEKPSRGRPPFEITDYVIEKAETLAAQGMTLEQIARVLGICYKTLNEKKKEYGVLSEAIKSGKAKGVATITNALFQTAKEGNVTAQIFFLKNASPESFRDRHEHEHTGKGGGPIRTITSDMTAQEAAEAYADTLKAGGNPG